MLDTSYAVANVDCKLSGYRNGVYSSSLSVYREVVGAYEVGENLGRGVLGRGSRGASCVDGKPAANRNLLRICRILLRFYRKRE